MKKFNRVFLIVTDSLGIGGDKEAKKYGDKGSNTLLHISENAELVIPTWKKLGIDSIAKITGFNKSINQTAYMARMFEYSNAKDTLAGHWEMMGHVTEKAMPTFTENGFPKEMIDILEKSFDGRKIVGNKSSSGTEIIVEFAEEEINENKIIVYTSSDSVLQICGHEEHMGLDKLYEYCQKARDICDSNPDWKVGRIIARPYIGVKGSYERTSNRHDYAIEPPKNLIDDLYENTDTRIISVGKIFDIFSGRGFHEANKTTGDANGMDVIIDLAVKNSVNEFIFANLVDFDMKFGHRRDVQGYADNINMFDIKLAKLINALKDDDLLIITSDHGNDPTWVGSDHTREEVPVTIFSKSFEGKRKALEKFEGFATIGNIIADNFEVGMLSAGQNRTDELK